MDYILKIDNFYPDPDYIRYRALQSSYIPPRVDSSGQTIDGWRGFRSIIEYRPEVAIIKEKVCEYFSLSESEYWIDTFFHYSIEDTKTTCSPSFEEYKFHRDSERYEYAGVVYLYPNPSDNSGTTVIDPDTSDSILIDNVYNRLICYPSNLLHGPTDLFGHDLQTGRLTLTFFLRRM